MTTLLCLGSVLQAEPKGKKSKNSEAVATAPAQIRVWKDVFETDRAIKVVIRSNKKPGVELHLSQGLQFLDYQEVPNDSLTVDIYNESDAKTRVASTSVSLDSNQFITLLLHENAGRITFEVIDDSLQPDGNSGEFSVRSFIDNLTLVRIKIGDDVNVQLEGVEPLARFRGLARKVVQVDTVGVEASGKQLNWTNELDLKSNQRATLLILMDAYGRMRPRIVVDGALR